MAAALEEDEVDNDDYYSLLNVRREVSDPKQRDIGRYRISAVRFLCPSQKKNL